MDTHADLYQILNLASNCTGKEITESYQSLAKIYHPDKASSENEKDIFEKKFKEIQLAYHTLKDSRSKDFYDNCLVKKFDELKFQYSDGHNLPYEKADEEFVPEEFSEKFVKTHFADNSNIASFQKNIDTPKSFEDLLKERENFNVSLSNDQEKMQECCSESEEKQSEFFNNYFEKKRKDLIKNKAMVKESVLPTPQEFRETREGQVKNSGLLLSGPIEPQTFEDNLLINHEIQNIEDPKPEELVQNTEELFLERMEQDKEFKSESFVVEFGNSNLELLDTIIDSIEENKKETN